MNEPARVPWSALPPAHRELWEEARPVVLPLVRLLCLHMGPPETLFLAVVASPASAAATVLKTFFRTTVIVREDQVTLAVLTGTRVVDFLWGYAQRSVSWPEPGQLAVHVLIVDADEVGYIGRIGFRQREPALRIVQ